MPSPIFYKVIDRHRRLYAVTPVFHFIRPQVMIVTPEILHRQAATFLEQSHTAQALPLL